MTLRRRIAQTAGLAAGLLGLAASVRSDVLPVTSSEFGFRRAAFLARGMAARPVGMGEAFTAVADDASAISWNPGGLGLCRDPQGVVQYDDAGNGLSLVYGAVAFPVARQIVGLSLTSLSYGSYELRNAEGAVTGTKDARDLAVAFSIAAANPVFLGGYTGVAVERVDEAVGGGALYGVSAGGMIPAGPGLRAGWAVLHLGSKKNGFGLPSSARLGASWLMSPRLRLAVEGGLRLEDRAARVSAGAELLPVRAIALRMGYTHSSEDRQSLGGLTGFGAGAGIRAGKFGLDYAYQPFGELAVSHRFAFVYAVGPSAAERQQAEFEEAHAIALSTLGPRKTGLTMISAELERDATQAYRDAAAAFAAGDHSTAVSKSTDAVKLNPFYWEAWQLKGNALHAQGDLQGAIAAYKKSLELHPENPELSAHLTRIMPAAQTAPKKEPPAGKQSASPAPGASAPGTVSEATALYVAGDYDGAWRKASAILTADRTNWEAWQIVGNCQYAKGDKAGALVSYRESLRLHPDNPQLKAFVDSLPK